MYPAYERDNLSVFRPVTCNRSAEEKVETYEEKHDLFAEFGARASGEDGAR